MPILELKVRLLESLWHRDAVARRSSGRGIEILRQFHRLGTGWAAVAVYETWGDLFFEAYDPLTTSTMTLQVDPRGMKMGTGLRMGDLCGLFVGVGWFRKSQL